jgi:hypothetical protein
MTRTGEQDPRAVTGARYGTRGQRAAVAAASYSRGACSRGGLPHCPVPTARGAPKIARCHAGAGTAWAANLTGRPPRASHPVAVQEHSQGRARRASPMAMAQAQPLSVILPGKDPGDYQEKGESRRTQPVITGQAVPVLACSTSIG